MDIVISPAKLAGNIEAISSKSDGHRALICAALCREETVIELNCISQDIEATVGCINSLGAYAEIEEGKIIVKGAKYLESATLDCNESGSTARFLLPVAAALCKEVTLTGKGRLPQRPFTEICKVLEENGCKTNSNSLPITVAGEMKSGNYEIAGNVSSQYISGLLFALPLLSGNSKIILTSPLQSSAYVDMTINTLKVFGINIEITQYGYFVKGNQQYISPKTYKVEGDWSNSAFFVGANAVGSKINIGGLNANSLQGDKKIIEIAENIENITELDVSEIPDLVPIISVVFALNKGKRAIVNAKRLRIKESDRIKSVCNMINALGGNAIEYEDSIVIEGGTLEGGCIDSASDHRIVMAGAVAATCCKNKVTIKNAQAVAKSYPDFFKDYEKLGGNVNVL